MNAKNRERIIYGNWNLEFFICLLCQMNLDEAEVLMPNSQFICVSFVNFKGIFSRFSCKTDVVGYFNLSWLRLSMFWILHRLMLLERVWPNDHWPFVIQSESIILDEITHLIVCHTKMPFRALPCIKTPYMSNFLSSVHSRQLSVACPLEMSIRNVFRQMARKTIP